jgi:cell wall-associated NlpC family hydrolase
MPSRSDVIGAARQHLGVAFRHQGRGAAGIDCVGLIIAVGRAIGVGLDWPELPYQRFPPESSVRAVLNTYLDPLKGDPEPGDVALLRWRRTANHLAIIGDGDQPFTLIHAYQGQDRVVEHRADRLWRDRVVGCWIYRGVEL